MIKWRIKRENRMIVKYIGYMGIVIMFLFDLSFLLFSCTEQAKIGSDILHSNTTIEVQHIASPSTPPTISL